MLSKYADFSLEIKAIEGRQFEGYGAVFGNVDLGGDIVVPGAFKRSLARHKASGTMPLMFWMHQPDQVPGLWLDMGEDQEGLYVKGDLVNTQLGSEVRELLTRKAVRGLSIGYQAQEVDYDRQGNRLLKQIDVVEVSVVSMAMNPLASVYAAKARLSAYGEYVPTTRELEHRLRDAGFSKSVARSLSARIYGDAAGGMPADRRDAGDVDPCETEILDALARLTDSVGAEAIRRPQI